MTHKGEPTRQEIDVSDVSQLFGLVTMKLYSYIQPKCSYMWVCHDSSVGSQTQRHHDYSCRSKMTYIVNIASSEISKHCNLKKTRSSADADKPARRVYRSVKVTKHSTIPYIRYSFLLCNSNFKMRHFYDMRPQKMSWPWNGGQRSLKVIESGTIR